MNAVEKLWTWKYDRMCVEQLEGRREFVEQDEGDSGGLRLVGQRPEFNHPLLQRWSECNKPSECGSGTEELEGFGSAIFPTSSMT